MKLILIRHGMTEANERRLYCGRTDLPLSESGREELLRLRESVDYPDIAGMRVITSGMKRCDETLRILYGDIAHEVDHALCEMDFGAFEMRSYDEMKNDADYIAWISGDNEKNVTPGGESGEMMKKRALAALSRIVSDDVDAAVFTHGGVIAADMAHAFPDEHKNMYEWQPSPGRGYAVEVDDDGADGAHDYRAI